MSETLIHLGPQTLKLNEYSYFNSIMLIFFIRQTCFMLAFELFTSLEMLSLQSLLKNAFNTSKKLT